MMKRLLLLILLTSWSQLCSSAPKCDTGIVLYGHIPNIVGSQRAKARVDFVHAYNSSSLQACLDDCCAGTHGLCSIATYRNQSTEVNCLYFYCRPLSHCKFYPSISSDSYSFPATELRNGAGAENASSNISKNLRSAIHNLKSHARSVSARKGVENVIVSRKGVMPDNVTTEGLSLKNDNTTVKPRKGVEFIDEGLDSSTTDSIGSTLSVIDSRKEVTQGFTTEGRTKIKPRKGVEDLPVHIVPTRTRVDPDSTPIRTSTPVTEVSDLLSTTTSTPKATQDNELMSMLQNVFQDDMNTSEPSNKVPQSSYVPHGSVSLETIRSSEVLLPSTPSVHLQTSMRTHASSSSNVPESTVSGFSSSLSSVTYPRSSSRFSTAQLPTSSFSSDSIESTKRSSTKFTYPASLSIKPSSAPAYHLLTPSLAVIVSSESVMPSPSVRNFPEATSVAPTTISSPAKPLLGGSAAEETENERRYRSSMHLVISLVFGLVVLFAVLGAVAKRIYDVWMRRHYHRMDFLIDGLYDGYS